MADGMPEMTPPPQMPPPAAPTAPAAAASAAGGTAAGHGMMIIIAALVIVVVVGAAGAYLYISSASHSIESHITAINYNNTQANQSTTISNPYSTYNATPAYKDNITLTEITGPINGSWSYLAASSSGSVIAAAQQAPYSETGGEGVYVSTNSGSSWEYALANVSVAGLAISADGSIILASYCAGIYRSSDSGSMWTVFNYTSFLDYQLACPTAISPNGQYAITTDGLGNAWISTNQGEKWTNTNNSGGWTAFAYSSNGGELFGAKGESLYSSSNYGESWTLLENVSGWESVAPYFKQGVGNGVNYTISGIAVSSDGSKVAVVFNCGCGGGSNIFYSTNAGKGWSLGNSTFNLGLLGVAGSSTGQDLAAIEPLGDIFTSTNFGANWTDRGNANDWTGVAVTGSGSTLIFSDNKEIYSASG
jgi:hypothetical protein